MLRIGVWDTGPGIPEDSLPTIFEEFRQLGGPGRGRGKGLGLGLAIVDRISRMLDHPIWVRSRPGHAVCRRCSPGVAPAAATSGRRRRSGLRGQAAAGRRRSRDR